MRYVLEGSAQRSASHVRINAQLIDAGTDAHLWAGRFDGDTGDLFALQDEITRRIASSLEAELIAAEARRPIEQPDALDYILWGRAIALKPPTRERMAEAIAMYERALAVEPASVDLWYCENFRRLHPLLDDVAANTRHNRPTSS